MEHWLELRRKRLATRRLPFPIAYTESPTGGVMYVPDEFLLHEDLEGVLGVQLGNARVIAPEDRIDPPSTDWLDGTGLRAYGWSGEPADLPLFVAELRAAADDDRAALHYILSGENKAPTVPRGGPATAPALSDPASTPSDWGDDASSAVVAVLDTGIYVKSQAMEALTPTGQHAVVFRMPSPGTPGDIDELHPTPYGPPLPILGAEAGHGSFIASLVERMALGGVRLEVHKVLDADGLGTEQSVVEALRAIRLRHGAKPKVINLSLGGFTDDGGWTRDPEIIALYGDRTDLMPLGLGAELALWSGDPLNETVFVCAAGNDGQVRKFWPAAAAGEPRDGAAPVVAVASFAVDQSPSWFTNSGPWVTLTALGEDIVSDYPAGEFPCGPGQETESFPGGGARWSGTSFAAPLVSAEIARRAKAGPNGLPSSGAAAWQTFAQDLAGGSSIQDLGWQWDIRTIVPQRDPTVP